MTKSYTIIFNGSEPFIVKDTGNQIIVYKNSNKNEIIASFVYIKLFVGLHDIDPNKYIGNTLLAEIEKNKYIFISGQYGIVEFETDAEIIFYSSPMGNNLYPYTYAIDVNNKYYLLLEQVCFTMDDWAKNKFQRDPYRYYYTISAIIGKNWDRNYSPYKSKIYEAFYVGDEKRDLRFSVCESFFEKYTRLIYSNKYNPEGVVDMTGDSDKLYVKYNEIKIEVNRDSLIDIMTRHGELIRCSRINGFRFLYMVDGTKIE
jgi:hypothetical protein